jgi:crotonobetainyl-CoA:carnitine CoA-transferase CaiB-like acyl-CoA transferase
MFQNLKVVELASVLAGPLTGTFFAELGATVIKIENKLTQGVVVIGPRWSFGKKKE